jgi:hypothetical protein
VLDPIDGTKSFLKGADDSLYVVCLSGEICCIWLVIIYIFITM